MLQHIHAAYNTSDAAARAVGALLDHGIDSRDVSVYVKDLPHEWRDHVPMGGDVEGMAERGITVTTAADAMGGAAKGAAMGVGIGVLAAVAALTLPGVGIVLGGGALATALGGVAATTAAGAVAGGAYGYMKDQGADEATAQRVSDHLEGGGVLVTVATGGEDVSKIRAILAKYADHDKAVDWPVENDDMREEYPIVERNYDGTAIDPVGVRSNYQTPPAAPL